VVVGVLLTSANAVGVLCKPDAAAAGTFVDIMTSGEIVEAGLVAGTTYFAVLASGALSATPSVVRVGHTVEASRLVVRFQTGQ